jgi:hypothetical protein
MENPTTFQSYIKTQLQISNTMWISNQTDFTEEFVAPSPTGHR